MPLACALVLAAAVAAGDGAEAGTPTSPPLPYREFVHPGAPSSSPDAVPPLHAPSVKTLSFEGRAGIAVCRLCGGLLLGGAASLRSEPIVVGAFAELSIPPGEPGRSTAENPVQDRVVSGFLGGFVTGDLAPGFALELGLQPSWWTVFHYQGGSEHGRGWAPFAGIRLEYAVPFVPDRAGMAIAGFLRLPLGMICLSTSLGCLRNGPIAGIALQGWMALPLRRPRTQPVDPT